MSKGEKANMIDNLLKYAPKAFKSFVLNRPRLFFDLHSYFFLYEI
jgi:hypothetical protein